MTTTTPNTLSQKEYDPYDAEARSQSLYEIANRAGTNYKDNVELVNAAALLLRLRDAHDALVETLRMALTCQNNNCMQCKSVLRHTLAEFDAKHAQPAAGGEER